jgi:hypothetical protein
VLDIAVFERDAETFCAALGTLRYQYLAGLQLALALAPLYDDFAHLFRADTFGELLEAPVEPKARQALLDFVALGFLSDRTRDYTERLAVQRAAVTILWDDRAIPVGAAPLVWASEPDARRRHDFESHWRTALATLRPLYEERHRTWLEAVPSLDERGYVALWEELREFRLADVREAARHLLAATERGYLDSLDDWLATIGLNRADATLADLPWLFRAQRFDDSFAAKTLLSTLYRWLRDFGVDLEEQASITFDLAPRPLKAPTGYCVRLGVPRDVRIGLRPLGGWLDYKTLWGHAGRAVQAAQTDRTLPFPFRWLGDGAVREAHGLLFSRLLTNEAWLARYVGPEPIADFRRLAELEWLFALRRAASRAIFEDLLHTTSNYDALAEAYAELCTLQLGVEWPAEPFLVDVGLGLRAAVSLRAWIFASQLERYLEREFDQEWFRSSRAARFLRDLWREGQKYRVDELARFMGYAGLDLRPMTEALQIGVG